MSQATAALNRRLLDANLTKRIALPSAAGTVNSASIDLGSVNLGSASDELEGEISYEATPSLANSATLTMTVQDSADNSSFAAVASLATLVVTGSGGTGAAASSRTFRLPPTTRRYVRISIVESSAGGDNSAKYGTLKLFANC